jgi:ribonuclease Z
MRLIFFGTSGAVPSAGSGNVSLGLVLDGCCLLVDASGNPVQSLLRAGIDPLELEGVVLTHTHIDHLYGLPSLLHALWLMGRTRPLRFFSNSATAEAARGLFEVFQLTSKPGLFSLVWETGEELETLLPGGALLRLFPVEHSVPTSGVKLTEAGRALVYSADTGPCRRVAAEASGAAGLIHEASACAGDEDRLNRAGHSSGRQAAEAARRAGVKCLFLCHFDLKRSGAEEVRKEAAESFKGRLVVPELFSAYEIQA